MTRFKVKVCGITRPTDAIAAWECGADMIGMIFYRPSPRFVSSANAQQIVRGLPTTLERVGVFVNEAVDTILRIGERLRLDYIQLSGDESESSIAKIQRERYRVIKGFHIQKREDYHDVSHTIADICMLDSRTEDKYGGTGKAFDWTLRPPKRIKNLMLSGGITVENVAEGVELFDPLIVDVNSGVETKPGIKSVPKMEEFFNEIDEIKYGA
jgi:phosphoribosylanthranilate isomerase